MPVTAPTRRIHLSAAGVSLLLDATDGRIPAILHWGSALGEIDADDARTLFATSTPIASNNAVDQPLRLGVLPQETDGWMGRPGLTGSRADGSGFAPRLEVRAASLHAPGTADGYAASTAEPVGAIGSAASVGAPAADVASVADAADAAGTALSAEFTAAGAGRVRFDLADEVLGLAVALDIELLPSGLVRTRAEVVNTGADDYVVADLVTALPVPLDATELLDFGGRWGKERTPQRQVMGTGTHLREGRRGRTGADSAYVLHLGTAGFGFAEGEIWAIHTAFSGNHTHYAERLNSGVQVLGGGELLQAGEGRLAPGAAYRSPWVYGSHSAQGLDGVARRFHAHVRDRAAHGGLAAPDADRPVTLNVWEAVYFDHDLQRLVDLAEVAADLGVERFVLDDGWFGSRRDDTSGLGDWTVSADVWPDGLSPLIDRVTGLGMEFGLWFEPEMVNLDSDLARAHPEWIMAPSADRLPRESRTQQVLNLAIPEAWQHVHDAIDALLDEYEIGYIKWDHNRDLIEAAHRGTGAAGTHEQTLAVYRMFASLKQRHPGLEIESCSSGGARVDLGIVEIADRIWVSDCIDPLERAQMNRWTAQLLPFEVMGSHIASGASHTTGRLHSLSYRAASAVLGHLGIEWDLRQATPTELDELRAWIAYYKQERALLLTGDLVRADRGQDCLWITGVLSPERDRGLYTLVCVDTPDIAPVGRIRLPGLDPERRYRLTPRVIGEAPRGLVWPAWARAGADPATDTNHDAYRGGELVDGLVLPGSALTGAGITAPLMNPETAVLLEVAAID
ncbi:alpha-galactosidase [Brachybacterium sp. DNPG3]